MEKKEFPPLFPVALDHAFPDAQQAFEEARDLILNNYYSPAITKEALYWAAIEGMLRRVSPPEVPDLAKLWTADQYAKVLETLTGEQVSLGIKTTFSPSEGCLTVTDVMAGSPAETILSPMDRILRIGGQPLKGKTVDEVSRLLEGPEGTDVSLTVNRDIKIFDVSITRQKIETINLQTAQLTDTVYLIRLKSFPLNISKDLKESLDKIQAKGAKAVILDLRDNYGGVFSEALRVADLFVPKSHVILRSVQRGSAPQNYVSGNENPCPLGVAILVNRQTASASEIVAASLRDNGRAFIVGTRTFGKGVFEKTFEMKNKCRIKFINGAMYSPKGESWQGRGVVPDFLVDQDARTLAQLYKLPVAERFRQDVAMITACKLLLR